jgi:hypothetical protein
MDFRHCMAFLFCLGFFHSLFPQIPFESSQSGHIIVKAKVNGVEGKFIFDTGAGINAVFTGFSKKLSNRKTGNFFTGHRATGEEMTADLYADAAFDVGGKIFANQQYAIIDFQFGDIDGLVSLQAFRNVPITIDYGKKQLVFDRNTIQDRSIDIELADYAGRALDIFTSVRINDTLNIQVLLDSGAGINSFWFSSKLMDTLHLKKENFRKVPVKSEFKKDNNYYFGRIRKLNTVGGLSGLADLKGAFVDGLIYEGKTSLDWLGKILTIDIGKKKIFIGE